MDAKYEDVRAMEDGSIFLTLFNGGDVRPRSGGSRVRRPFRLDLRALALATGIVAAKVGNDEYVIDAPPQPRLMAQLGDWLAGAGHPLHDLRAGGQRLEDVFRRLTGGAP